MSSGVSDLDARKFSKCCGLTWQEIYDDIASVYDLTGFESQAELDLLHNSFFHNESDYEFHDDEPTSKELDLQIKDNIRYELRCNRCPPRLYDNHERKPKHGKTKPRYKNKGKKQGRDAKTDLKRRSGY